MVNLVKSLEELRLSLREILGGATVETLATTGKILKNSMEELEGNPLREIPGKFCKHLLKEFREKSGEHTVSRAGSSPERNIGRNCYRDYVNSCRNFGMNVGQTLEGALRAWNFPAISFRGFSFFR